jgi:hypothetical protein
MTELYKKASFKALWVIFLGLWGASICAILGALCCLTIVGIPFGIKYFKFIKHIFLPSNLAVATRPRQKHLALNFFFAIFGGLYARYLSAFVQTIFSWLPFTKGLAFYLHNIRDYFVSPFDSEFCEYGKYSSTRDTRYDYNLLQRKIYKNPNLLIMDDKKGRVVTVKKHLKQHDNEIASITKTSRTTIFLAVAVMFFGFASMIALAPLGVPIVVITFIICVIMNDFQNNHLLRFYDKQMNGLMKLYNEDTPIENSKTRLKLDFIFNHLAAERAKHKQTIIKNSATKVLPQKKNINK